MPDPEDSIWKCLVVDDETINNEDDKEDIVMDLGISPDSVLFVADYDGAIEILKKERNIIICFIDYRIPKDIKIQYTEEKNRWGVSLIPKIRELNQKSKIVVYSAYVTKSYLQNEARKFNGVVTDFLDKSDGMPSRRKYYLDAVSTITSVGQSTMGISDANSHHGHFNYGELDEPSASLLRAKTKEIKGLLKKTARDVIQTGIYFNEVKQILNHGQFQRWIEGEIGLNRSTVWRMMSTAERFKSFSWEDLGYLGVSALYQLIDSKIPDEVIQETIEEAKRNQKIVSYTEAKQIKKEFKQENEAQLLANEIEAKRSTSTREIQSNAIEPFKYSEATPDLATKQDILKVIPLKREWILGQQQQHTVVAVEPNSEQFRRILPSSISLCCAFPPVQNWRPNLIPRASTLIFDSEYPDLETEMLLQVVDLAVKFTTNELDNVVVCFIPHPKILSLIHNLGCHVFIADPDRDKCAKLAEYFQQNLRKNG